MAGLSVDWNFWEVVIITILAFALRCFEGFLFKRLDSMMNVLLRIFLANTAYISLLFSNIMYLAVLRMNTIYSTRIYIAYQYTSLLLDKKKQMALAISCSFLSNTSVHMRAQQHIMRSLRFTRYFRFTFFSSTTPFLVPFRF